MVLALLLYERWHGTAFPLPWATGAVLDLAGGQLHFGLEIIRVGNQLQGKLCNGRECQTADARVVGDSVILDIADYAATVTGALRGDSLTGSYRNVGNRGPRTIPFRAARGRWPKSAAPPALLGRWMHHLARLGHQSACVRAEEWSCRARRYDHLQHRGLRSLRRWSGCRQLRARAFDGSFVYLLTGKLTGDTLRGIFHAGLRTQTPWVAVRNTGKQHLNSPLEVTGADTTAPFRFDFQDLDGRRITNDDARFRNKVVLVDVFGSWCPTCHYAAPELVQLYRRYRARGLEVVGLAYEVTGDTAVDRRQLRRYRDKFGITFPLLLAGINDTEAAAATLPQLTGFTSFPTTLFLGRDGGYAEFTRASTDPQPVPSISDYCKSTRPRSRSCWMKKREP